MALLVGCSDGYIPNYIKEKIGEVMPGDHAEHYIDWINEQYGHFLPEPIERLSGSFALRIIGVGGFVGHSYMTEVIENDDGTGTIIYRDFRNQRISVYRKEVVVEPVLRSLLDFRTDMSTIMELSMFQNDSGDYIHDGYAWVIEAFDGKNRRFIFRASNTALEESFSTLLEELNRFER